VRDRNHEKGVFSDLHRLKPDDEVTVDRADGTTAEFRVEQYSKDASRTVEVYGDGCGLSRSTPSRVRQSRLTQPT
jgi:hypothetical protein